MTCLPPKNKYNESFNNNIKIEKYTTTIDLLEFYKFQKSIKVKARKIWNHNYDVLASKTSSKKEWIRTEGKNALRLK